MSSCWFPSLAPFNLWHQKPDQFLERKKLVWGGGEGSNETSRPIGACKATSDIMLNVGLKMKNFPRNVERFVQPASWYHQWTQLLIWQNPWEANIWCVFSTSSRINHSASFCFPGFVDVAPLQGTNLFWIREGDESHDLSRHFLPFLSPFLFYKVRCFEGNDSWMRLNRGWESSIWMHNTVNRILSRKKDSRAT